MRILSEVGYKKPPVEHQFKPGHTLSKGRTEGARNRLNKAFLTAMAEAFEENGINAIKTVVSDDPKEFLKLIAGLQPKEHADVTNRLDDITDEQLDEVAERIRRELANSEGSGDGDSKPQEVQQAQVLPTVQ